MLFCIILFNFSKEKQLWTGWNKKEKEELPLRQRLPLLFGLLLIRAKIPRKNIERELKKELAIHLYSIGVLSLGGARKMSELNKLDFHHFLGERKISRHYGIDDYQKDIENIKKWKRG